MAAGPSQSAGPAEVARARLVEEKRAQEAAQEAEDEPDPVADAFADMGMAPVITKTKRHDAINPWAERGPVSSNLAMADCDDDGSGGWDDGGDTLDLRAERCLSLLPSPPTPRRQPRSLLLDALAPSRPRHFPHSRHAAQAKTRGGARARRART